MEVQHTPLKVHYHIYWSEENKLDWEAFDTNKEAIESALELARHGESFLIKASYSATCAACKNTRAIRASQSNHSA